MNLKHNHPMGILCSRRHIRPEGTSSRGTFILVSASTNSFGGHVSHLRSFLLLSSVRLCVACWTAKYSRSIEKQLAAHAEAEKELQSQIKSLHDQLEASQVQADRKQTMVDNLSEVGNVPDWWVVCPIVQTSQRATPPGAVIATVIEFGGVP